MAQTQVGRKLLRNRDLTGASFSDKLGVFDETKNYAKDSIVWWNGERYKALTNIASSALEGDLSRTPDISSDWEKLKPFIVNIVPSNNQTINNNRQTILFDNISYTSYDNLVNINNGEVTFNRSGTFLINCTVTFDSSSAYYENTIISIPQIDNGSGYTDINSKIYNYSSNSQNGKETSNIIIPIDINSGDKFRLQSYCTENFNMSTISDGCNILIYNISGYSGPQGVPGEPGPQGDLRWTGTYDNTRQYLTYDVVEYNGSSYVAENNTIGVNPGTPDNINYPWALIAEKGSNGSGSSVNIYDHGTFKGTYSDINYEGDIVNVEDNNGTANIIINDRKNTYTQVIWAEENGILSNDRYEWAFGNGANTPNNRGLAIYVPSNYKCEAVAMGLCLRNGTAKVEFEINGSSQENNGGYVEITNTGTYSNIHEFAPILINNNDRINFKTVSSSGTSQPNTVTLYLKYTEL